MRSLGIPQECVTLTPFVVDNDWWMQQSKLVDRAGVRASWGISPNDVVIVFSGKLQPWKRPLDLLRAFAKADLPNALLLFAGTGPLLPQLESEAASLGVASRVLFLGFLNQTQLPAIYSAADLLVLPSESEPFGVVVNEAMCCGCAVAASDRCGAARDLVSPVDPRLVFPCGDIAGLAKVLRDATTDRPRLQFIRRAGLAHIRTWSPERNIAATTEAIRLCVERACRSTGPKNNSSAAAVERSAAHQQRQR
jgi:glycosyltransferase involved in cell wall biosynthesis